MIKAQRKSTSSSEREDNARHYYKIQKNLQNKKLMKNLDKALRNRDYVKLVKSDDY